MDVGGIEYLEILSAIVVYFVSMYGVLVSITAFTYVSPVYWHRYYEMLSFVHPLLWIVRYC